MSEKHYPDVDPNPNFAAIETEILASWAKSGLFQRSVDNRPSMLPLPPGEGRGEGPSTGTSNEFIFYDGPPFANGLPHYGHLLTGFVKDLFARYQTMRGKRVERRFGWDCHGLPAEMGSEKELGISGRQAIIKFGIDKFNEHCRTSVMKYTREWEHYVTRQARWVDFKNDYKTMDTNFMESVLWAFKQLYDKGLVYEAYRVMPYSWAAETPLSNFETKLDNSYREREDKAITVAFELNTPPHGAPEGFKKYCILAWTTTPWTLPSNLALAVSTKVKYVFVGKEDTCYILSAHAADILAPIIGTRSEDGKVYSVTSIGNDGGKNFTGERLLGLSYHPLFPYFASHKHSFKILDGSNFVTDSDGTGIVHMAPGFGEEDQKCCEAAGIEIVVPVDGQGKFTDAIYDIPLKPSPSGRGQGEGLSPRKLPHPDPLPEGEGMFSLHGLNVIAEPGGSKFGLANDRIIDYLKATGQLIKQEQIKHNYPHCWRTDQPLIYRAMPSWYVEVTKFRDRAAELNKQINWIPEHIRDGQMGHMLATAPDWSISRNRFWGTPIPVWKGDKGGIKVFGSIAELKEFFKPSPSGRGQGEGASSREHPHPGPLPEGEGEFDLHRPHIDTLVKTDEHGQTWRRVEDVFDCWFESGSMPFAQVHYPFENKQWFEDHFPADFITEYVGQTRGWFNTLIMLSTALFDKPPFKNCICHGVVLDAETGLKYSKRLKNYKDPLEVIDQFGADALRWLMIASPVMRGQDLMVDPDGKFIRDVVRLAIKPIWNAYNFFTLYANADGVKALTVDSGQLSKHELSTAHCLLSTNIMDRYILAKCRAAVAQIEKSLDAYDTPSACDAVLQFFEALNNWYIRRNKERFWKHDHDADKQAAYDTLYTVLTTMCRAAAPLLPLITEEIYRGLTGFKPSPSGRGSGEGSSTPTDRTSGSPHPDPLPGGEGISVHLTNFPSTHALDMDENNLIVRMDWVRDVCNAALAVRNNVQIRVRQPLRSLSLAATHTIRFIEDEFPLEAMWGIIRDEVNVKEIHNSIAFNDVATLKLSINSAVLGKRLPEKMKQILPASKKGEWKQIGGSVEIAGEKLLPGEYVLQLEPKPEYKDRAQALSTNDALVILDTHITPELEAEGIARDVVRMVQQARKDAKLDVSDRIKLFIGGTPALAAAITAHQPYIMDQTLTAELLAAAPANAVYSVENTLDDQKITIALARA